MIPEDKALFFARRVKDVINSESYQQTIGAWLKEIKDNAVQNLASIDHGDAKIWGYQAEIKVVNLIEAKIQVQLDKAERDRVKKLKEKDNGRK